MQFELEAKKSLGQNFLKNTTIIQKMVDSCVKIATKDTIVLEIGPGTGALTEYILKTGLETIAIEADDRAIPLLTEKFKENKNFTLIHEDVRVFDISNIKKPYILLANIPYYLTGYITRKFLESENQPKAMIIMVQKEVALRINDKKSSLASLGIHTYGTPRILTHVSKGNFVPAPKVDSSVLVVENIQRDLFPNKELEATYWELAKKGFGNKRKQLGGTALKGTTHAELTQYLKKRPEDLQVEDWVKIAKIYTEIGK
ncbi:MAG: 16S rRNA (adenine(1518)-N(6)/adenine(1519)-N(6))-dimethyltransferase RsmA [Patescibacteria group bacterium]